VRAFYTPSAGVARAVRVAPYAGLYLLAFLRELITANIDVAYRVLAPSMPIHPAVMEVPLRVRTDFAITVIANSITLTPGTLTMDYHADDNVLYVHSIDASDPESILEPIRTWEDYALVIFDEDLKPGDPAPQPVRGRKPGDDRPRVRQPTEEQPDDRASRDADGTDAGGEVN
jgi:multicomponent Na+:H+ antiporter subunit E